MGAEFGLAVVPPCAHARSRACSREGIALNTFTADASSALGGPDWLVRRRADAWQRFSASSIPTEAEEVWRYSGIDAFDLGAYGPVSSSTSSASEPAIAFARRLADSLGPRAGLVITRNGSVEAIELSASAPEALSVAGGAVGTGTRRGTTPVSDSGAPETLGVLAPGRDAFGELHDAFMTDVVIVTVSGKTVVPDPVVVVHLVDPGAPDGPGVAVFPRTLVDLGSSSEAGVIELTASTGVGDTHPAGDESGTASGAALVIPVTELRVADDAHLHYGNLQVLDQRATSIATQASCVGRDGSLQSFTAGLGGRYARVRTDSDLVGQAGRTSLLAAYLGTNQQVHDFRTLQDHHAPRTES